MTEPLRLSRTGDHNPTRRLHGFLPSHNSPANSTTTLYNLSPSTPLVQLHSNQLTSRTSGQGGLIS